MFNAVLVSLFFVSIHISLTSQYRWCGHSRPRRNRCVLPSYPTNGEYVVSGKTTAFPGQSFDTVRLNVSCSPGFKLIGSNSILCIDGDWSEKLPECSRSCKLDKHPSVEYRCVISGNSSEEGYRDCDLDELVGTVVKPECNAPNYYRSGVLSNMRCTNSGWDYVAVCTPECGRVTSEGKEQIAGGRPAKHGELPWHAGIYSKATTPYKQICGGSLVSTTVVISAAHCFWNKEEEKLQPASQFVVAVGKMNRLWGDPTDVDAQVSEVSQIKVPSQYQGVNTNFQDDIAVVVLNTTIVYQTYVRPVCMDFNKVFERRQLQNGNIGKVAGWGLTAANGPPSTMLKVLDTPFVDIIKCIEEAPPRFKEFITSDKICAGREDGNAVCEGDSGGGLVFSAVDSGTERYYLRGVVSTAPASDDACNAFAITSYTQVSAHTSFIEENTVFFNGEAPERSESQVNNFCILPPYPKYGSYAVKGEPTAYPGQAFPAVQLNVSCDPGYAPEDNATLDCSEGWWSNDLPRCTRLCQLDRNPSIEYRCLTNDKNNTRECNDEEPHGTTIRPECKDPYFSREELPLMTCVEGSWDNHPTCRPGCGKVSPATDGHLPWHVVIYIIRNDTKRALSFCGGTLISLSTVLSAAYCFWDDPTVSLDDEEHVSYHFVSAGKRNREITDPHNTGAQYSQINYIRAEYKFSRNKTKADNKNTFCLAILRKPFKLTPQVSPVCLDFDATFDIKQLQPGAVGKVSSRLAVPVYGKNSSEIMHKILEMSYRDHDTCVNTTTASTLAADTFCARGIIDNSFRPCLVYRGTGFSVPDLEHDGGERYYLRGVITLGYDNEFCTTDKYAGITHVLPHEKFILTEGAFTNDPTDLNWQNFINKASALLPITIANTTKVPPIS